MLLIKNVTIRDSRSKHHGKKRDIHIRNGKIESIKAKIDIPKVKVRNAWGVILGKALYENKITIEETKKLS